jgi:hypothetical protein
MARAEGLARPFEEGRQLAINEGFSLEKVRNGTDLVPFRCINRQFLVVYRSPGIRDARTKLNRGQRIGW